MEDRISLNLFPEITHEDLSKSFWGTQDFGMINDGIIQAIIRLKNVNKQIIKVEEELLKIRFQYDKKYRETYLSLDENKTQIVKKMYAEMACEDLGYKKACLEETSKQLVRISYEIKSELDALNMLSFNIRQELKL